MRRRRDRRVAAASTGAPWPALLTTVSASSVVAVSPPTSSSMPCGVAVARSAGECSASIAPAACASPSSASIRPWLSMMPVDGDSSARVHRSCGSSAIASSALSQRRSRHAVGERAVRDHLQLRDLGVVVATISLPQRRWST